MTCLVACSIVNKPTAYQPRSYYCVHLSNIRQLTDWFAVSTLRSISSTADWCWFTLLVTDSSCTTIKRFEVSRVNGNQLQIIHGTNHHYINDRQTQISGGKYGDQRRLPDWRTPSPAAPWLSSVLQCWQDDSSGNCRETGGPYPAKSCPHMTCKHEPQYCVFDHPSSIYRYT